jgi:glycerophosphoryl diester phosphodiesterase
MELPPPPWVVAHRGASGERLENTIDACRLAVATGAPMLEVDVQLAADDELVVFHDADLLRLGGGDRRAVEAMTSRELAAVELALVRPDQERADHSPGTPLRGRAPTLAELLAALPPAYPLDVEIKRFTASYSRLARGVAQTLAERPNVLVSSFDWQALAFVKTLLPHLRVAPIEGRRPEAALDAAQKLDAWSLHVHRRLASAELVAAARSAGRPLLVYTVNDGGEARALFALGVSGVFTDYPARLLRELAPAARC